MTYGSVIFDMDGVILDFRGDNFKWKYNAVEMALKREGLEKDFSRSELDAFIGDKGMQEMIKISNKYGLEPRKVWEIIAEETSKARGQMFKQGKFKLHPHVENTLELLQEEKVLLGLISNAPEIAVKETVSFFDLKHFFKFYRGITDFDDLTQRKPHPDHLVYAEAELKREPYLFVGDAESDVMAAKNAGIDSAWVNRTDSSSDLRPDYEMSDLNGLAEIVLKE